MTVLWLAKTWVPIRAYEVMREMLPMYHGVENQSFGMYMYGFQFESELWLNRFVVESNNLVRHYQQKAAITAAKRTLFV